MKLRVLIMTVSVVSPLACAADNEGSKVGVRRLDAEIYQLPCYFSSNASWRAEKSLSGQGCTFIDLVAQTRLDKAWEPVSTCIHTCGAMPIEYGD